MSYTTIDNPELYFQVKAYTGNGGTQSITLDGSEDMQPDWIWLKDRNNAYSHQLVDAVRGNTKYLNSDENEAENTATDRVTSFDSDGFSLGSYIGTNKSSSNVVAWCWKESATAGFDIVSYTGNATARTISHSLSAVPKFMIAKDRTASNTNRWTIYHQSIGNENILHLELTNAKANESYWNDTTPTSSVFSVSNEETVNGNSNTYIAYLFAEKQGFSKFGSYQGNSNANGSFIYCGFSPAWIMVKKTNESDSADWLILDNKRDTFNPRDSHLDANQPDAESSASWVYCDHLSNGFKWRANDETHNESGSTYIFMAFAEAPFVNSKGVPANAR